MGTEWFDEIGLAYAKNYDEIEAARQGFDVQRNALTGQLDELCIRELSNQRADYFLGKRDGGWSCIWIRGHYEEAREELTTNKGPHGGVCFGFGNDPNFVAHGGGRFGFGTYLMFKIGATFDEIRGDLTPFMKELDYVESEGFMYFRPAWITPDSARFTREVMFHEVKTLAAKFSAADELVARLYRAAKGR